jgi:hypothetical protein
MNWVPPGGVEECRGESDVEKLTVFLAYGRTHRPNPITPEIVKSEKNYSKLDKSAKVKPAQG